MRRHDNEGGGSKWSEYNNLPDVVVGGDVQFSKPPCSAAQRILLQVAFDGQGNVLWQDGVQQTLLCGQPEGGVHSETQDMAPAEG